MDLKQSSKFANLTLLLALIGLAAIGIIVFGAKLGLWEPIVGFGYARQTINPIGYAISALALACLIYLFTRSNRTGKGKALFALVVGLGILTPTIMTTMRAPVRLPAIHDITTNTDAPPEFVVLTDSRPGARNTLAYGGQEIASQQKQAYPDILTIQSELAPADAFTKAVDIGQDMGWEIVDEDSVAMRYEASATTPFFAFIDDVVVVVTPNEDGSYIDLRSVSRIGRGDRGMNAERIREFIAAFIS